MKKLILAVLLCTSFSALADSQTYCNPDGAGGQICNTYGSGDSDSGQSYTSLTGRVALLLTHMVKMVPLLKLFVALMELVVRFVILIKRCI